uniref:Retrotransposon gag domain-containing protein n=1 Tax=Nicotiana tabacum TaxID=4097 RepID=A0A1S4CM42_TOBAC|nr:PREDICTED: uncharacterized protein LOC107820512 [Nicotiana tabacum]
MADKFITIHAGAKKAEPRVNDIFAVKQSLGEGLKDFLARFKRIRMTLSSMPEGMAVVAFQNGLSRDGSRETRKLLCRLMKCPPTNWEKIHNAYCAEVRADEDDLNGPTHRLISVQTESRKERREDIRRDYPVSRPNRERYQPYVRAAVAHSLRYEEEIVYALEKLGTKVKWQPKMRSDPNIRKSDTLCEFHQERGHKTEDCTTLRQDVVNMLPQGQLKELLRDKGRNNFTKGCKYQGSPKPLSPACTISMIIGGGNNTSINVVKFTTTHKLKRSITRERYDKLEESIIFDELDANGLTFPHNDALVITLCILDTVVKCIMVDGGSGVCIIHPQVLTQMRLEDKIVSY